MFFDDHPAENIHCPTCRSTQPVFLIESLNFGNLLALCDTCDTEWDYTPIDHDGIRREAKQGFVYQP